ncbi:hypothetical protein YC2023_076978 [Brassica napus]
MRMMRSDIHHTTQPPPRLLGEEREGRQYGERDERGVREKERKGKYKLDGYGFLVSSNLYRASLPFSLQRNRGGGTSLYKKIEENSRVHEGHERLVATVYPNVDCAFIVTLIFIFDLVIWLELGPDCYFERKCGLRICRSWISVKPHAKQSEHAIKDEKK